MYMGSEASNGHLYEYDNRGRTVKEEVKIDSVTYTTLYAYDAADRVKAMTYPGGEAVTTVYNSQGLPETLTGSQAYVTEAGYNALGQKKRYTLGNGAVTTWTYYGEAGPPTPNLPSYRLWQVRTVTGSIEHQKLQYTYDSVGNVLTIADYKVAGGTQTQTFTYDSLDRLLTAKADGGSAGQGQYSLETYTYNSIGNMTSKGGLSYSYPTAEDPRPHAVRRVSGSGGTAKTVQIRAYSTPCNDGVRATMELWVNGVRQQTWSNVAASWTTYQQSVVLSGNDQVEVVFTNDCSAGGYDRNLFVDYVVVDGRTIQAEGGAAVVDRGAGTASFDGLDVIAGQEGIVWSAALRLVVGPQASAACYDQDGNMTRRLRDGVAYGQTWDSENVRHEVAG